MLPPIAPQLDHASLNGALTGVSVRNAEGEVVFEQLGDTRLIPASNQKILSVLYALEKLGPDFQGEIRVWETEYGPTVSALGTPGVTFEQLRELGQGGTTARAWPRRQRRHGAGSPGVCASHSTHLGMG